MSSNTHLNTVFDNHKAMSEIAYDLQHLAKAFDTTGNHTVADQLYHHTIEIMKWANKVRDSHGEDLDQRFKDSQAMTGTILKTLIGGIEMGKTGENNGSTL